MTSTIYSEIPWFELFFAQVPWEILKKYIEFNLLVIIVPRGIICVNVKEYNKFNHAWSCPSGLMAHIRKHNKKYTNNLNIWFLETPLYPKTLLTVAFVISQLILKQIFICIHLNFGYFTRICNWDTHNLTHTGLDLLRVVPLA